MNFETRSLSSKNYPCVPGSPFTHYTGPTCTPAPVFNSRSELISYYSSKTDPHKNPMPMPIELQDVVLHEEWDYRTRTIFTHLSRFFWPKLLRVYLVAGIFFSLVGPVIVNVVVNGFFFADVAPLRLNATNEQVLERIALIRKAHFINFIVSLLFILLVWLPYFTYKTIGRKRLSVILAAFSATDLKKGDMSALVWTCARTSTLQANASISIHLPVALLSARQPSLFSNGAYLPPYLQKASAPPHQAPANPNPANPNPVNLNPGFVQPAPAYEYPPPFQK